MLNVGALLGHIARGHSTKPKHLYHFTSVANLPSIGEHGLLSQRRILELGIPDVDYASDSTGRYSDRRKNLDGFVHLCFFDQHRMVHVASDRCKSGEIGFVHVAPAVLLLPGVLLSNGPAYREGVVIGEVLPMLAKLDWDVMYSQTDWHDRDLRKRLDAAYTYEILVPGMIDTDYLLNL